MTYEIKKYGCCGSEYYIVTLTYGGLLLAQLMTIDLEEAQDFIEKRLNKKIDRLNLSNDKPNG